MRLSTQQKVNQLYKATSQLYCQMCYAAAIDEMPMDVYTALEKQYRTAKQLRRKYEARLIRRIK